MLTTIDGAAGANRITLSGNGATQILNVVSGANLAADNVNFTRGSNNGNGAIGGAIANSGTLTLSNSALYSNSAQNGGAIATVSGSTTNLTNATISGNSAAQFGGGIYNAATVTATICTITENTAQFTGGAITFNNATFNSRNTIIAGNVATSTVSPTPDANGNFTSNGYNLLGKADGANGFGATGDQTGTNAAPLDSRLAPLGNYGGKTLTHALLDGGAAPSPAINTGTSTNSPATDQRGASRVGVVDKGAFEVNNPPNSGTFVAVLPSGSQNAGYQTQITANNGAFTYSLTSGALPNGITLTTNFAPAAIVALTGTPTQSGTFNFAITANSGTNSNVTNYQLQVLAPTAASVSISGRVISPQELGLTNALVTLTDSSGVSRTILTGKFGVFRFNEVAAGETYIISASSKRRTYAPQIVTPVENITGITFTAQ